MSSKTPPESRRKTWSEASFAELPSKSVPRHHQAQEEVVPTPSRRASRTTSSSGDGEEEPIGEPPTVRQKPLVERELETIIIREKPVVYESSPDQARAKPPMSPVAAVSDGMEGEGSKAPPVVLQSRIAPLIDTGPEHLHLDRPAIQPQPTVHVTIGRIEVRAVQSSQPASRSRAATPVMNLDDYLRRRSQGGRQ
ncbi:MAG TPA: hypothetical protein VGW76_16385 [Pyrinomonadaceae bacterium]|nr:hypothetical protein [Pyrinomonadaceae bacterium]